MGRAPPAPLYLSRPRPGRARPLEPPPLPSPPPLRPLPRPLNPPRLASAPRSAAWCNAVISSGWRQTICPLLTERVYESLALTFAELELPKTLKAITLLDLHLGDRPPMVLTAAAAGGAGPPGSVGPGCAGQVDFVWEAEDASLTLGFAMANVASQPRLRLRRLSMRGTARLHWEWTPSYPYVGKVRFCFLRPPQIDVALEPLTGIDVTTLPGVGHWIRYALRDAIVACACHPYWVETDLRLAGPDSLATQTATPPESASGMPGSTQLSAPVPTLPPMSTGPTPSSVPVVGAAVPPMVPPPVDSLLRGAGAGTEPAAAGASEGA